MYPLPQRDRFKSRTINTVAEDLNKTKPTGVDTGSHFLNCRYDPFGKTPIKTYIPDGRLKNAVVRDIKIAHNLVVSGSEVMNIQIMPWLPFPVRFSANGYLTSGGVPINSTVDSIALGGNNAPSLPPAPIAPYLAAVFPNAIRSTFNVPVVAGAISDTNNFVSARITTIGYRLIYTGQASAAQGTIIATDIGWSLDSKVSANTLVMAQYTATTAATVQAADSINAGYGPVLTVGIPNTNTTLFATNQTVLRPENGLKGVLKYQRSPDSHEPQPWYENGMVLCILDTANRAEVPITVRNLGVYGSGSIGQYQLVDPSLMGVNIQITGAGSYRLEVAVCYEQELALNNTMIDMARGSPMMNHNVLEVDSLLNSTVHPAALNDPITDATSMLNNMSLDGRPTNRRKRKRRGARKRNKNPKLPNLQVCVGQPKQRKTRNKPICPGR